jgi:hypothetical protein
MMEYFLCEPFRAAKLLQPSWLSIIVIVQRPCHRYTIDCLMTRYRGVDWSHDSQMRCNNKNNPTFLKSSNGHSVDPLEVLFVKRKNNTRVSDPFVVDKFTQYFMGTGDITKNNPKLTI